jgi:hypothetical protein
MGPCRHDEEVDRHALLKRLVEVQEPLSERKTDCTPP